MSKLSELRSKGEDVTLSNGLIMNIKPMRLGVEADVGEFIDKNNTSQAMLLMVRDAIKMSIPDATDEEIDEMNKEDLKLISKKVLQINGIGENKEKNL